MSLQNISGCVTLDKYIKGRNLEEIERILGFNNGRLKNGMKVVALTQLPQQYQFELQGYNQVASHKFDKNILKGLDVNVLKQNVIKNVWQLTGPNRLVKVIPITPHNDNLDPDKQYPPGQGVPQWVISRPHCVPGVIVATVTNYPSGKY